MLTPTGFGYTTVQEYPRSSPIHTPQRPKLYGLESMMPVHDYHQPMMTPHQHPHVLTPMTPHPHVMTPRNEHEPLAMHVPQPQQYYGPNMLLVSSDYGYNAGVSPASVGETTPRNSNKRSRADLNLKEKKRMFKLNDRINQLKDILDNAGIQCKKNKQSVLDNAVHFIDQLRSDLVIAKQKAELAEREAEMFKCKAKKAIEDKDSFASKTFTQSTLARIIVDLDIKPVSINSAFLEWSGYHENFLRTNEQLKQVLCTDKEKLEAIVHQVSVSKNPTSTIVDAITKQGVVSCTLLLSPLTDETGNSSHIEFSVIPMHCDNVKPELSSVDFSEALGL